MREKKKTAAGWYVLLVAAMGLAIGGCSRNVGTEELAYDWGLDEETFASWDDDDTGFIEEDELESGLVSDGIVDQLDANGDGSLDENEYARTDLEAGFEELDEDDSGLLETDEFASGLFESWDQNDDDLLGNDEFGV